METRRTTARPVFATAIVALAIAGCTPAEDSSSPSTASSGIANTEEDLVDPAASPSPSTGDSTSDAPSPMLEHTAWRTTGEDGATYATYLDSDGRYRDTKNGDLAQEGSWRVRGDGALCFLPDGENSEGECWDVGEVDKDGEAEATAQDGHKIEIQQIDYQASDDETKK